MGDLGEKPSGARSHFENIEVVTTPGPGAGLGKGLRWVAVEPTTSGSSEHPPGSPTDDQLARPADGVVVLGASGTWSEDERVMAKAAAAQVLDTALAPEHRDDRFDGDWPPEEFIVAIEFREGQATGYVGGPRTGAGIVVQGLLADDDDPASSADRAERLLDDLLARLDHQDASNPAPIEFWAHPARPWHETLADRRRWQPHRALHQLRCTLPVAIETTSLVTRAFETGRDEDALIRVNNRAFASHPDQGGMTRQRLAEAAAQPWFEPAGIRLYDDPDQPGVLAGFCWTKIHQPSAAGQPMLGEIYAIGIDPDHHGRGLGVPMTAAGLDWLAAQDLDTGMLYVEADNEPALRTYDRLGFHHHRTDRAWRGASA